MCSPDEATYFVYCLLTHKVKCPKQIHSNLTKLLRFMSSTCPQCVCNVNGYIFMCRIRIQQICMDPCLNEISNVGFVESGYIGSMILLFSAYCTGNNFSLIKINVNQMDETAADRRTEGFHISHILLYRLL